MGWNFEFEMMHVRPGCLNVSLASVDEAAAVVSCTILTLVRFDVMMMYVQWCHSHKTAREAVVESCDSRILSPAEWN